MARRYAAIMALVGMSVVLVRGLVRGAGLEESITASLVWMAIFATIGTLVGGVAQQTIEESVQSLMEQELAASDDALGSST